MTSQRKSETPKLQWLPVKGHAENRFQKAILEDGRVILIKPSGDWQRSFVVIFDKQLSAAALPDMATAKQVAELVVQRVSCGPT